MDVQAQLKDLGSQRGCFHHEQMRRGRDGSNLESYLSQVGPVVVHTLTDADVLRIVREHNIALPEGKYPAHPVGASHPSLILKMEVECSLVRKLRLRRAAAQR